MFRYFYAYNAGVLSARLRQHEAASITLARLLDRYVMGVSLARLGRDREALGYFETIGELPGNPEWVAEAPAAFEAAKIHERNGNPEVALARYRKVVEVWGEADEELQPVVREARARVEALSGQ